MRAPTSESLKRRHISLYFKGIVMGVADVIPGVSGGTVAFITGIYRALIEALSSVRFRHAGALLAWLCFWRPAASRRKNIETLLEIHWGFLIPLGLGVVTAILSMARFIPYVLENYPVETYAFFFGLIAYSAVILFRSVGRDLYSAGVLLLAAAATFFLLAPTGEIVQTQPGLSYIFMSGAIAVCALILPGISGAYILVLLGSYHTVLSALKNKELLIVSIFVVGMATGIFSFVRVIKFFLTHHYRLTMAALTGIMVGSLRKLWPYSYFESHPPGSLPPSDWLIYTLILMGCVTIFLLERFALHFGEAPGHPAGSTSRPKSLQL